MKKTMIVGRYWAVWGMACLWVLGFAVPGAHGDPEEGAACHSESGAILAQFEYECAKGDKQSGESGGTMNYQHGECETENPLAGLMEKITPAGGPTHRYDAAGVETIGTQSTKVPGGQGTGICESPTCLLDPCCSAESGSKTGSHVDGVNGRYHDAVTDLSIYVPAYHLRLTRSYNDSSMVFGGLEDLNTGMLGNWTVRELISSNIRCALPFKDTPAVSYNGFTMWRTGSDGDTHRFSYEATELQIMPSTNTTSGYQARVYNKRSGRWQLFDLAASSGSSSYIARPVRFGDDTTDFTLVRSQTPVVTTNQITSGNGYMIGYATNYPVAEIRLTRSGQPLMSFTYDERGRLLEATTHKGEQQTVTYSYDGNLLTNVVYSPGEDSLSYTYDGNGRLSTKTEKPLGKTYNVVYQLDGRVAHVLDQDGWGHSYDYSEDTGSNVRYMRDTVSNGDVLEYWFDGENGYQLSKMMRNGVLIQEIITDKVNGTRRSYVDNMGNMIVVTTSKDGSTQRTTYPDGTFEVSRFDPETLRLLFSEDVRGLKNAFTYNDKGWLTKMVLSQGDPDETWVLQQYNEIGMMLTQSVFAAGAAEPIRHQTWQYDEDGRILKAFENGTCVADYAYDARGLLVSNTLPTGGTVTYTYNELGLETAKYDPYGELIQSNRYNSIGLRDVHVDQAFHEMHLTYDTLGRLASVTDPLNRTTTYTYDAKGNVETVTQPDGTMKIYAYDLESGAPLSEVDVNGLGTRYEYGSRLESFEQGCASCGKAMLPVAIDTFGFRREIAYDLMGRVSQTRVHVSSNDVVETAYQYLTGENGTVVHMAAGTIRREYHYDKSLRNTEVRVQNGAEQLVFKAGYNVLGFITNYVDSLGYNWGFVKDAHDRTLSETLPSGAVYSNVFDASGQRIRRTYPSGRVSEHDYNWRGRKVGMRHYLPHSPVPEVESITISKLGFPVAFSNAAAAYVRDYDLAGRLLSESCRFASGVTVSNLYGYLYGTQMTSWTDAFGVTYDYTYDESGRPRSIALPGVGSIVVAEYDQLWPTVIMLPGGTRIERSYYTDGRVRSQRVLDPAGNDILAQSSTLNAEGYIASMATEHGDYSFVYDGMMQLVQAVQPHTRPRHYTYDAGGNRVADVNGTNYRFSVDYELLEMGDRRYGYDADGRVAWQAVAGQTNYYVWDARGYLQAIQDAAGQPVAQYEYRTSGQRVRKETGGQTRYYAYFGYGANAELDGNGNVLRTWGYPPDEEHFGTVPMWVYDGQQYLFFLTDVLGRPVALVNTSGAVVWEARYDAFGQAAVVVGAELDQPMRASGQFYDAESGLHYNFMRYYDPTTGRYLSRDPHPEKEMFNSYAFVLNSPVNFADITGAAISAKGKTAACAKAGGEFKMKKGPKLKVSAYMECCNECSMDQSLKAKPKTSCKVCTEMGGAAGGNREWATKLCGTPDGTLCGAAGGKEKDCAKYEAGAGGWTAGAELCVSESEADSICCKNFGFGECTLTREKSWAVEGKAGIGRGFVPGTSGGLFLGGALKGVGSGSISL